MKRLILAVSLVAIAMTASAQIKSAADIQKAIASAEKVAENPKKAANTVPQPSSSRGYNPAPPAASFFD